MGVASDRAHRRAERVAQGFMEGVVVAHGGGHFQGGVTGGGAVQGLDRFLLRCVGRAGSVAVSGFQELKQLGDVEQLRGTDEHRPQLRQASLDDRAVGVAEDHRERAGDLGVVSVAVSHSRRALIGCFHFRSA